MLDFWNDAKKVLGTVAPGLATAIGGPLAGLATTAIIQALGLPDGSDEESVANAVKGANADQLLALKKAEYEFKTQMQGLEIDLEALHAADRDSARQREVQVKDFVPSFLAVAITGGFFGILLIIMIYGTPKEGGEALLILLGGLGTGFGAIIQYYFGSSRGSASKDVMIGNLANGRFPK